MLLSFLRGAVGSRHANKIKIRDNPLARVRANPQVVITTLTMRSSRLSYMS